MTEFCAASIFVPLLRLRVEVVSVKLKLAPKFEDFVTALRDYQVISDAELAEVA